MGTLDVDTLSLKQLSLKLTAFLAILTGQRVQTLQHISLDNIHLADDKCVITINKLLKTSRPGYHLKPLTFHAYDLPNLCVIRHITRYIALTETLRGINKQLFVSYFKPHNSVGSNTLSRWIKQVLSAAGINIDIYKAHSTRSACSSKLVSSVSIDTVLKFIGWSKETTFTKFYNKPITPVTKVCLPKILLDQARH